MPLVDALSFVARNFDNYLRVLREPPRPARPPSPRDYGRSAYPPTYYSGTYDGYYARPQPASHQPASYDRRGAETRSEAVGQHGGGGYREEGGGRQQVESNLSAEAIGEMISKLQGSQPGKKDLFHDIVLNSF